MKVTDMIGFEEIALKWTEISKAGARGEILGYQIQYWLSELHENPVFESTKHSFEILAPNRTAMIRGLQAFAYYRIRILAFNEGGFGVWSSEYGGGMFVSYLCLRLITVNRRNANKDSWILVRYGIVLSKIDALGCGLELKQISFRVYGKRQVSAL